MEFLLSKLLPIFVYPLGAALLATLVALVLLRSHRRLAVVMLLAGFAYLWLGSTPRMAQELVHRLESEHPPVLISALPNADVIVLLGGGVIETGYRAAEADQNHAADRLWHAMRLYRAGKAPRVLVTGGPMHSDKVSEADRLAMLLQEIGVPESALLIERRSRNTRENATNSAALLNGLVTGPVLLVTSATHMPRAVRLFEAAGIAVIPAATDYRAPIDGAWGRNVWLPQAWALEQTTEALKEYLASAYDQLRGR